MDTEIVQVTESRVKAGDPSFLENDEIDKSSGSIPYCFKLKDDHAEGALSAIAPYKPWWADIKQNWAPAINAARIKFKNWTQDHFTNKDREATHVAMNSGKLVIPLGPEEDEFIDLYSKCLLAGHRMYFVEQLRYSWSPPCFRLFMDLDFKQLAPITERGIEAASCVCATTVSNFFPSNPSHTIVASTTYKNCSTVDASGNKVQLVKTGIHLYWPKHFVTPMQARHIRESILADLTETFGMRMAPEMNTWEDVVDDSVYAKTSGAQGSGLRMMGSCKTDICSGCKGRKKDRAGLKCADCDGNGRVDDRDNSGRLGRPYMMLCVLKAPEADARGILFVNRRNIEMEVRYQNSMIDLIKDTKIRTSITEPTLHNFFELPPGAPLYISATKKSSGPSAAGRGERQIDPSDPIHLEFQKVIRESFGELYNRVVVRKVTRGAKAKHFTVSVTGQNCRYCQNIGREHGSNNIYFVVSREHGCVQRCHDSGPKIPEMRHGTCNEYTSANIVVSVASMAILWPETTDNFSIYAGGGLIGMCNQDVGVKHVSANGAIDQVSQKPNDSFLMKALINNIDFHCRSLWPDSPSWPSLARLKRIGRGHFRDFLPQDPRDLGTLGAVAYKNIGMLWSDSLLQIIGTKQSPDGECPKELKSIRFHEKQVTEAFNAIITISATASDPSIFDSCETLDDFIKCGAKPESDDDFELASGLYI